MPGVLAGNVAGHDAAADPPAAWELRAAPSDALSPARWDGRPRDGSPLCRNSSSSSSSSSSNSSKLPADAGAFLCSGVARPWVPGCTLPGCTLF